MDHSRWQLEMWANAQRGGRPAKYRWRPLFNATKFGWRPILECRAVTLPRHETPWNLQGCPKLMKRSQPLVRRSSPYSKDMWRRYCCLTSFFSGCRYVPQLWRYSPTKLWDGAKMAIFWVFLRPAFSASRMQQISDMHSKAPFTRYNMLSIQLSNWFDNRLNVCIHDTTSLTTGCIVYTNIQPVCQTLLTTDWQLAVSCKQTSNWFDNRLYRVNGV